MSCPELEGIQLEPLWARLRPSLVPTTFVASERLDAAIGRGIHVELVSETFQHTGSFKFRAASAAVLLGRSERLLTASSGNFGAALALAAARAGKKALVVMPSQSSATKIARVSGYGAEVDLIDTTRIGRNERVRELHAADPEADLVSPYDDARVIAGNASLGAELFGRLDVDRVVVPVGGGGLASGIVVGRDATGASTPILGAEPLLANDAARSLRSGTLCRNEGEPPTLCDGARTASLGVRNFVILRRGLEDILEVDDALVERALVLLFAEANLKAEPTGALALAAVLGNPERFAGQRVACVVSGGNVDAPLYAKLLSK